MHGGLNVDPALPSDFAFLDGRHVLIVTGGTSPIRCVAAFDNTSFPPGRHLYADVLQKHAVLVLDLPKTARGTDARLDAAIWSCPRLPAVAAQSVHADDTAWFRWADGSLAVVVQVSSYDTKDAEREFNIVIPGRAITACIAAHADGRAPQGPVPWCDWAPSVLMHDVSPFSGRPSVCGSRYLREGTSVRLDENGEYVQDTVAAVYHLDSRAALLQENDVDNANEDEEDDSDDDDEGLPAVYRYIGRFDDMPPDSNMWAETVSGGAWYRDTWTDIILRDEGESAYLVEDGIVVLGQPLTEGV